MWYGWALSWGQLCAEIGTCVVEYPGLQFLEPEGKVRGRVFVLGGAIVGSLLHGIDTVIVYSNIVTAVFEMEDLDIDD